MEIQFRAHHFLCALCFQGKGYSSVFIQNFSQIMETLNGPEGDDTLITITQQNDSICSPCPHNQQDGTCESQTVITRLDEAHAQALALNNIQKISWGDAKLRIKKNVSLEVFDRICTQCSWKTSGLCEKVLQPFLQE